MWAPHRRGLRPLGGRGGFPASQLNNIALVRSQDASAASARPLPALLRFRPTNWGHNGCHSPGSPAPPEPPAGNKRSWGIPVSLVPGAVGRRQSRPLEQMGRSTQRVGAQGEGHRAGGVGRRGRGPRRASATGARSRLFLQQTPPFCLLSPVSPVSVAPWPPSPAVVTLPWTGLSLQRGRGARAESNEPFCFAN